MLKNFLSCCYPKQKSYDIGEFETFFIRKNTKEMTDSIIIKPKEKNEEKIFRKNSLRSVLHTKCESNRTNEKFTLTEILNYPKIELIEIDGNILNGKIIEINAAGMLRGSLRNANDGITCFGIDDNKNNGINDFHLNISNIYYSASTIFKIFFDKNKISYYISAEQNNNDSVIFVKIDKALKIKSDKKYIVSLGEVHFFVEINNNKDLVLGFANTYEDLQIKVFPKESHKIVKIGRNKENQVSLEGYGFSRIHTTFFYNENDNQWFIRDGYENKSSTNGTWIYLDWPFKIDDQLFFRIGANFLKLVKKA